MSKIYENGIIRDMTDEEIAAMQDAAARAEAEEKHRPLSAVEVQEMLLRQQINTLSVDDQTAYRMKGFYPEWAAGEAYTVGYKLLYGGELYKVLQAHTSQADWTPDAVPALFVRIDEQHDGTKYDPIPASRGMEYEYGLYYSDGEDGKLYLCKREGATVGDKIILQYMPHELIGQYFTEVAG